MAVEVCRRAAECGGCLAAVPGGLLVARAAAPEAPQKPALGVAPRGLLGVGGGGGVGEARALAGAENLLVGHAALGSRRAFLMELRLGPLPTSLLLRHPRAPLRGLRAGGSAVGLLAMPARGLLAAALQLSLLLPDTAALAHAWHQCQERDEDDRGYYGDDDDRAGGHWIPLLSPRLRLARAFPAPLAPNRQAEKRAPRRAGSIHAASDRSMGRSRLR